MGSAKRAWAFMSLAIHLSPHASSAQVVRVATIARFIGGPIEQRDEYQVGLVSGVLRTGTGTVIISDRVLNWVRAFNDQGRLLWSLESVGQGPGDISVPCCLAPAGGGGFWLGELGNRRWSRFTASGEAVAFVESVKMPGVLEPPPEATGIVGSNLQHVSRRSGPPGSRASSTVRLVDTKGIIVAERVVLHPTPDSLVFVELSKRIAGGKSRIRLVPPFAPQYVLSFSSGGSSARALSSHYDIEVLDAAGRRTARIRREVVVTAVTRQEADSARVAYEEQVMAYKAEEPPPIHIPSRKPPIVSLAFDRDGRLWVERAVAHRAKRRAADLFDQQGRWLATATWPAAVSHWTAATSGWSGFGTRVDSDGVVEVVTLRW